MRSTNTVTCSFSLDRNLYNAYKSIIVRHGANVKGDLIRYMTTVIENDKPNAETLAAMQECEEMIRTGCGKAYSDVNEMMQELLS